MESPEVVFTIAGLPITATVVATWGMVVALSILGIVGGRRVSERPGRWQAAVEWGLRSIDGALNEMAGGQTTRYVPLVATLGLFILVANTMSVIPFVEAPTADINTPAALAIIVFVSTHFYGIRELGARAYLANFLKPTPLLLPINLISQISRTVSLAVRLFGNMMSHQVIVAIILLILPLVVPALLEIFGLFIGAIQAYIFTILTIVYIGGAVRAGGEFS
jgi:F-type H+-transporting ATPase subunit a